MQWITALCYVCMLKCIPSEYIKHTKKDVPFKIYLPGRPRARFLGGMSHILLYRTNGFYYELVLYSYYGMASTDFKELKLTTNRVMKFYLR